MGGGLLLAFCLATVLGFAYTLTSPTSSLAEEPAAAGESATSASWADAVVEAAEGQLDAVVDPSEGWNVQFVSDCLSAAGVEGMPEADDAQAWLDALQQSEDELYAAPADHEPAAGDIVFFAGDEKDADGQALAGTMGIVSEVTPATDDAPAQIVVIEAHEDGAVVSNTYPVDDESILGYGLLPEQPAETVAAPEESEGEKNEGTVALDNTLTYEAEDYTVAVKVSGEATVADGSEPAPESDGLTMNTTALDASAPAYQAAEAYVEDSDPESVISVSALEFEFVYNGQALDVSDCDVTAEVTPSDQLQAEANAIETDEDTSDEAEVGVALTALQSAEGSEAEELDTVLVEKDATERPTMTLALNAAAPALQLVAREALNPTFTVQYYGWLDMLVQNDSGYLKVIDTSDDADGDGGNLPKNGVDPKKTGLYVEDDGTLASEMSLEKLYTENTYSYFEAPSLPYVNIFRDNGNYTANEVWVLNEGEDPNSTNEADWKVYKNINQATELHFTNNPDKANQPNTILIEDGTVIRLVAKQTTSSYDKAAVFYDYDITEDGVNTWEQGIGGQGINDPSNYSAYAEDTPRLAFGNANTGTGLHLQRWNGNYINQYNRQNPSDSTSPVLGYMGCTFGLVTGLDDNGYIQYADGVAVPNLFDKGSAKGKTTYTNYSLGFNRSGDTYTLSSVNGAGLDNLESFNNPSYPNGTVHKTIWTNNFWPMDGVQGTDPHTGKYDLDYYYSHGENRAVQTYVGSNGTNHYPPSDDGVDHNNLFGMQYSINFELTEDYCGPLEYYFFGDDDMWVFLDGKLVCDIGGVHSSVGAYVNLWDYIEKGDAGKHTLKFYYTERGLSGSTCYMQFTLPSVSEDIPQYQNGQLEIKKQVVGNADPDTEFSFDITIDTADGMEHQSDYAIVRYDATGKQIDRSLLSDGKGTFNLKADEYVIIDYLQHGTKYTITETEVPDSCIVSSTIDSGEPIQSATVTGTTPVGKNSIVLFTNTFRPKLPNTGGPGTIVFTLGGAAVIATAVTYGFYQRKRSSC